MSCGAIADSASVDLKRIEDFNRYQVQRIEKGRDQIIGLEILIADKGVSVESRMGHGLIRLVDNDPFWINDTVISFGARLTDNKINKIKGLVGSYEMSGEIGTLNSFWTKYAKEETRDLKRYILQLSPEEMEKVLDSLFLFMKEPKRFGKYRFLTNNCMTSITKVLNHSGITDKKNNQFIPVGVESWLDENQLSPYPALVLKSPAKFHQVLDLDVIKNESNEKILEKYSSEEIFYIYNHMHRLPRQKTTFLGRFLKENKIGVTRARKFQKVSRMLYQKCESDFCFEKLAVEERSLSISQRKDMEIKRLSKTEGSYSKLQSHSKIKHVLDLKLTKIISYKFIRVDDELKIKVKYKKRSRRTNIMKVKSKIFSLNRELFEEMLFIGDNKSNALSIYSL